MSLERRTPLPVGLYWIDVFGDNRAGFQDWRSANAAAVKVRATESFPDPAPGRDWLKFEVLTASAAWDAKRFGFPTMIKPGEPAITSSADTVQRPDPEKEPLDKLDEVLSSAGNMASLVVPIVGFVGLALVLSNLWTIESKRKIQKWKPH